MQTASATADSQGHWRTRLPTGAADAQGADLLITSGTDKLTLHDVLVGEVWFASGQSNMYFTMDRVPAYADLIAKTDLPGLRMFNAPLVTAVEPQDDIEGEWTLASPKTVPGYSAVAFFFARKLHLDLGIPVGVIKSAWGGKPVETFTSRQALNTLPGTKTLVDQAAADDASYDPQKAQAAYEIVINGVDEAAVARGMRAGLEAAAGEGVPAVSAGNYGGKLGKFHFHLRALG